MKWFRKKNRAGEHRQPLASEAPKTNVEAINRHILYHNADLCFSQHRYLYTKGEYINYILNDKPTIPHLFGAN